MKKQPDLFVWLRSQLRSISRKYPPLYQALAAAKKPYKGDNPRQKFCYECTKCKNTFPAKEVAIDHRVDCGSMKGWEDVQGFMQRLFCDANGLDVLCHTCHDLKTYMTRHSVSEQEAAIAKEVIAIFKSNTKEEIIDFIKAHDYNDVYATNNEVNRKAAVKLILEEIL